MTGRELLAVARDLLERAEEAPAGCTASAMYRSAINRAYYGLFTACVATLNRVGFQVNNSSNAHAHVQQALNNSRQPDVVDASSRLRALSLDRRRADYAPADVLIGTRALAEHAVTAAEGALTLLEGVPVADLGAIATAILNWATTAGSTTITRKSGKA
jgi:uncharacterized protein (UPF0332 family)